MPSVKPGESRDDYVSRCVPYLIDEGKPQNQAVAECESLWSERKMADTQALLADVKSRSSRSGLVTADRYFREVEGCFDGGFCPVESAAAKSEGDWRKALSEAESRLTYSNPRMRVLRKSIAKADGSEGILQFDCIVTTPRRDHDGDVLMTKGAKLNKSAPLLWQHIAMSPIGKLVKQIKQTSDVLQARFVIADTALGRDAATLVKLGALRISHGFEPTDWEAMEDEEGYLFKAFNIFEVSLVSLPSNEDAVVTALTGKSFDSPLVRGWQKSVTGCRCKGKVSVPADVKDESEPESNDAEPLSIARTPSFEGTETTSWGDVSKTFEAFREGYYKHSGASSEDKPSKIEDAPAVMKDWMAARSLLGNPKASEFADLVFFPVVNPGTNKLNKGALKAVLSGRGAQADISDAALKSARAKAKGLLKRHFKKSLDDRIITKDFDVERQHVEAAKLEYDWISRFCSCEVKQLINHSTHSARIKMGSFLTGLKHALKNSLEVDGRRLTGDGLETPLGYETIQLNSKSSDNFLVDGISFRKMPDGTCFAVKFVRTWTGEAVDVFSSRKDHDKICGILGEAWKWADENNFLKGEAFSLLGEFLPKTSETWGDLFLDPVNEREIKRTVDLLNAKGKDAPNRGQVYLGPPGTGKTLSGRLLRNHADAAFIWVAGKDSYYFGGTDAIIQAFELAKELSPAIIFMEDIDATFLYDRPIDVLKGEMDGIGRSSGIVTVLTTNHPHKFPEALLDRPGRFHDVLKFDLPDDRIRKEMLAKWLPDLTAKAVATTVQETKGYSGAHLYELCQYAKSLRETDEVQIDEAVTKALKKIADQRDLIDQALMRDRNLAGRRREADPPMLKGRAITKSFVGESRERSFPDIEREYFAELAKRDADALRRAHRHVSLMLTAAQEREEARELDEVLAMFS